jgi:transcriptional regulator with XRE-family HTH domain
VTTPSGLDPLIFGHRLRHYRRASGQTLEQLGHVLGRPPSYLSQLENGRREPRLSTVNQLAQALGCSVGDLLEPTPPNHRAGLEVTLAHMQEDPAYAAMKLPYLRPSAKLDDATLEHLVALYERVRQLSVARPATSPAEGFDGRSPGSGARAANAAMRHDMRRRDNYFADIEKVAGEALGAVGYQGPGTVSERHLTDVAAFFGFTLARVQDLPPSTRSITDVAGRVIYVPQRNNATTRTARPHR